MATNFLELATTLKYLGAKWLPEKKLILRPEMSYLTIIPRVRVGYELAIIISYPTSTSGIIVLLKIINKYY